MLTDVNFFFMYFMLFVSHVLLFKLFFKFILCVWAFCVHGCLCPTCMQCHLEARRHQISRDWSNRCCWSSWGAGNRNRSSGRAVNAPHHWATSLALPCFLCNWNCCLWSSSQWKARSLAYFMDFHGAFLFYFLFWVLILLKVVSIFRTILCFFYFIFLQILYRKKWSIKKLIRCISLENHWCRFPLRVHLCLLSYTMDSGSLHVSVW